jgi:hypothetical protein
MLSQILKIIKLLGLPCAAKMKRHHEQGLVHIRGYSACVCWWSLLNNGFLDAIADCESVKWLDFAGKHNCVPEVMATIIEYLTGIGLLKEINGQVSLTREGSVLLQEPRGMFELLWAYEPCLGNLDDMLAGKKKYGPDLTRRITYVGLGSGRLCEQLPYPVMRRMVLEHGCKMVLDLGCGDLAFLAGLCKQDSIVRGHGIDCSQEMISFNQQRLNENNYNNRLTCQVGDMFNLPGMPADLPEIDCVTACDTLHEYLADERDVIIKLLKDLRQRFPRAIFVIGEFCLQDAQWLAKHPTASLEHHLFHQLSNQQIGKAQQWNEIFTEAGLSVIEQQVYDIIGHGYFALR